MPLIFRGISNLTKTTVHVFMKLRLCFAFMFGPDFDLLLGLVSFNCPVRRYVLEWYAQCVI